MKKNKVKIKLILNLVTALIAFTSPVRAAETPASPTATEIKATFFSKERWGVSYFNYMNGPTLQQSEGGSINHFLTLKHNINPDWYIAGVFQPDSNISNGKSAVTMGDSYLQIGYPTIAKFQGGKVYGQVRYFLPMSEASTKAEVAGILSTRLYAEFETSSWHFTYVLIPKLYLNTKATEGQKTFSHHHWIQATYDLASSLALDFSVYPGWTYTRNSDTTFNNLLVYPGFTAKFSKYLSLSPYVELPLMKVEGKSTSVGASLSYSFL